MRCFLEYLMKLQELKFKEIDINATTEKARKKIETKINNFKKFNQLIAQFNAAEQDVIQQLFYLQKINNLLNQLTTDQEIFNWVNPTDEKNSWQANLLHFGINPDASFFLKGFQFAAAVAQQVGVIKKTNSNVADRDKTLQFIMGPYDISALKSMDEYELKRERDKLLNNETLEIGPCRIQYIVINFLLDQLAKTNNRIEEKIKEQTTILGLAEGKIAEMKTKERKPEDTEYVTQQLSKRQGNNEHIKLKMRDYPEQEFDLRIEDRGELAAEHNLDSYPVSIFFDDQAMFMMQFKDSPPIFKPVILSKYTQQGNLLDVAIKLRNMPQKKIATDAKFYFNQINDFCEKLLDAGVYHPDIKLSNFLVYGPYIFVSDRKTFTRKKNPKATEIRSTYLYCPPQFKDCMNFETNSFNKIAEQTTFNMEQFMAYEVGTALKEFLMKTQMDNVAQDFLNSTFNPALYFEEPIAEISNLSLLALELTRYEAEKRLSIQQFNGLLPYIALPPEEFYKKVEEILPSASLEITDELKAMQELLSINSITENSYNKACTIFRAVNNRKIPEARLHRMAEPLATKCYREYRKETFISYCDTIEISIKNISWKKASFFRKLLQIITFNFYKVDEVKASEKEIIDDIEIDDQVFSKDYNLLKRLPLKELSHLGSKANYLLDFFYEKGRLIAPKQSAISEKDTLGLKSTTFEATNYQQKKDDSPEGSSSPNPAQSSSLANKHSDLKLLPLQPGLSQIHTASLLNSVHSIPSALLTRGNNSPMHIEPNNNNPQAQPNAGFGIAGFLNNMFFSRAQPSTAAVNNTVDNVEQQQGAGWLNYIGAIFSRTPDTMPNQQNPREGTYPSALDGVD